MGILLILVQVALALLDLAAHVVTLNSWLVFLPGVLFLVLWLVGILNGAHFIIDRFKNIYVPVRRR